MPLDLLVHLLAGYAITTALSVGPLKVHPVAALLAGIGAGVVKEVVIDRHFDPEDFSMTAAGSSAAYVQFRIAF